MRDNEAHIHQFLDDFLKDKQEFEQYRKKDCQSRYFKNFSSCYKGDRISMILSGIAIGDICLEQNQRIEGIIVDPGLTLIDVKLTDGLEEWEGKTIGLGVCADLPRPGIVRAFSRVIAGDRQVAYFLPEEMGTDSRGKPTVNDDKLRHLALKYTKVVVGGQVIIDFTSSP